MIPLTFKAITQKDLHLLSSWFEDLATRRWIEPPTMRWFRYVQEGVESRAWLVYDAGRPVGLIQTGFDSDKTCYFLVVTNPAMRRRGYGKRMLETLITMQDPKTVSQLVGTVEPENTASIRCMLAAGFMQVSSQPDPEGFLHFSYPLRSGE